MGKKLILSTILLASIFFSLNGCVVTHRPPHGHAYGAPPIVHSYWYYYPDSRIYFHIKEGYYYYFLEGSWHRSYHLPRGWVLNSKYRVKLHLAGEPYREHEHHYRKYPIKNKRFYYSDRYDGHDIKLRHRDNYSDDYYKYRKDRKRKDYYDDNRRDYRDDRKHDRDHREDRRDYRDDRKYDREYREDRRNYRDDRKYDRDHREDHRNYRDDRKNDTGSLKDKPIFQQLERKYDRDNRGQKHTKPPVDAHNYGSGIENQNRNRQDNHGKPVVETGSHHKKEQQKSKDRDRKNKRRQDSENESENENSDESSRSWKKGKGYLKERE